MLKKIDFKLAKESVIKRCSGNEIFCRFSFPNATELVQRRDINEIEKKKIKIILLDRTDG